MHTRACVCVRVRVCGCLSAGVCLCLDWRCMYVYLLVVYADWPHVPIGLCMTTHAVLRNVYMLASEADNYGMLYTRSSSAQNFDLVGARKP